jgi:hypothetical protein
MAKQHLIRWSPFDGMGRMSKDGHHIATFVTFADATRAIDKLREEERHRRAPSQSWRRGQRCLADGPYGPPADVHATICGPSSANGAARARTSGAATAT